MKRIRRRLVAAVALVGVTAGFAHAPSFSRLTLDARDGTIAVELSLTPPDRDSDGRISAEEYATAREFLRTNAATWFELRPDGKSAALPPGEFIESFEQRTLAWRTTLPRAVSGSGTLTLPVLSRLGEGHREYVVVLRDGHVLADALLSRAEPELQFAWTSAATSTPPAAPRSPALGFVKLGIEHILTGYDHLLFLAGLVLVCRKLRDLLAVVTSFTAAHSITLGLATLGNVQLPSSLVEPLIAASIVFVGIENLVLRGTEPKRRWALAFAFGLIHGFGFAGALRDAGFGTGFAAWRALATFNLGVEAGQLALVALALPLLAWARTRPKVNAPLVQFASATVVVCGAFWLTERLGFAL